MRRLLLLLWSSATGLAFAQPSVLNPDLKAPNPLEALDTVFIEEMT